MTRKIHNFIKDWAGSMLIGCIAMTGVLVFTHHAESRVIYTGASGIGSGTIFTRHIADGTILNDDISSTTSISWSKLADNNVIIDPSFTYTGNLFVVSSKSSAMFTLDNDGQAVFTRNASVSGDVQITGALEVSGRASISHFGSTKARGDVYFNDGSGIARLAAGTSGTFLRTNGAGSDPTWAAATGGPVTASSSYKTNSVANGVTAASYSYGAGEFGANDGWTIHFIFVCDNTEGMLLKLDGTTLFEADCNATETMAVYVTLVNLGATNAQIWTAHYYSNLGLQSYNVTSSAIDTSDAGTISLVANGAITFDGWSLMRIDSI